MKKFLFILALLCLVLSTSAFAGGYVAVLETVADSAAKSKISLSNRQYLTNIMREEAIKQLPVVQNYTIMTSDNINAMLEPGKTWDDYCDDNTCLVDVGKRIQADYICQVRIGSFGSSLTLSAEIYETAGNKLMASFNGRGADIEELEDIVKQKSPNFFRSIKGNSTGFSGVGGISEIARADDYSYSGSKKFIVELVSEPAGAVPTIDGKADPKCLSTPCRVQVNEGNHRFVMTMERYDDAETLVDITHNNQKVELSLSPNFGFLVVQPKMDDAISGFGELGVAVDGNWTREETVQLDPGKHSVYLSHPCYDPVEFNVVIAKNKTETFDKAMPRGKGGLELSAEYDGEPQAVAVFIDGIEVGSTPYTGDVPLCAEVTLRGEDWVESVDVEPKWHQVVQVTHNLKNVPDGYVREEDATRANAKNAYDELDGKLAGESVPTNVENGKGSDSGRWAIFGVSTAIAVTGVVMAVIGNNQAKDAHDAGFDSPEEYEKNKDKAHSGQILRGVGIGIAIAGAVGIGISFAF